jgi:predicted transcriptional regulator of viral defense system
LDISPSGISARNRAVLKALNRSFTRPFSSQEASTILGVDRTSAQKLLGHLVSQGWLSRIRRNSYSVVPLDAASPSEWRIDPWLIAAQTFAPCYLGGWTAATYWSFTEQLFRDVVVMTQRRVRDRTPLIQDTRFRLKVLSPDKMFGTKPVWRGQVRIAISDPTRTLIDVLDDPTLGGGIRHGSDMLVAYFRSEHRDEDLLVQYGVRLGNRAIFKRLGFLIENLGLGTPELARACLENISSGVSKLDPSISSRGRILKRWNLAINAAVTKDKDS